MSYCKKKFVLCISTYLWRHNFLVLIFVGTKKGGVEVILEHLILIINNVCPCTNWKNKSYHMPLKTIFIKIFLFNRQKLTKYLFSLDRLRAIAQYFFLASSGLSNFLLDGVTHVGLFLCSLFCFIIFLPILF